MQEKTRLTTRADALNDATMEEWQRLHRDGFRLDESGFRGDSDVPLLGLDEMEDEVTMADARLLWLQAKAGIIERDKRIAIPISSATVEEARDARTNDIDDMEHPEWRNEE